MRTAAAIAILCLSLRVSNAAIYVPDGLAGGSEYQLLFVTEGVQTNQVVAVSVHHDFVRNEAARNPGLTGANDGVEWFAAVSTSSVNFPEFNTNARDNAVIGSDTPVYLLDGTLLATGEEDFWGVLDAPPNVNQFGDTYNGLVLTGSTPDGLIHPSGGVGQIGRRLGRSSSRFEWLTIQSFIAGAYPMYAVSEKLTVPGSASADFDEDGDVDGNDYLFWQRESGDGEALQLWQDQYGEAVGVMSGTLVVPEPSTVCILLSVFATMSVRWFHHGA